MVHWTGLLVCGFGVALGVGASTVPNFAVTVVMGTLVGLLGRQIASMVFEGPIYTTILHVIGLCTGCLVGAIWPVASWSLASGVLSIALVLVAASCVQTHLHVQIDPNILGGVAIVLSGLIGWLAFHTGSQYFRHSLAVWSSAMAACLLAGGVWWAFVPQPAPFFAPVIVVALGAASFFAFLSLQLWVMPTQILAIKQKQGEEQEGKKEEGQELPPKYPTEVLYQ